MRCGDAGSRSARNRRIVHKNAALAQNNKPSRRMSVVVYINSYARKL